MRSLLPEHTASTIAPHPFAQVSSLVDRVKVNLNGGETYKKNHLLKVVALLV